MMFQNGIDLILNNEQIKVSMPNIYFSLKFVKFETKVNTSLNSALLKSPRGIIKS